ncbi:MAG: stage II sporulation protein M [Anaerolineae bacterium]|nr:stage II sporulation protein M [Anaerolineae bacterium]
MGQRNKEGRMRDFRRRCLNQMRPTLIIAGKEIRDTLRDWRIVVPIFILVAGFPIMANFLAEQGLRYLNRFGAQIIFERLFPFLMLVVGFFPSTFSLVIALETFVGEKERRSLEALLATPVTDIQLYMGKLLAAVTPPVLASYLGMIIYVFMLGFGLDWWPSPAVMLLGFAMATVKALVMVSGAVIVSSQSTSVRAANLIASFIIVPMALLLQAEAALLLYANYSALWMIVLGLLVVNVILMRMGVRIFNREQLLGREFDKLDLRRGLSVFWQAVFPGKGLVALYRREIPALIKDMKAEIIVTLVVLIAGSLGLGIWGSVNIPLPAAAFNLEFSGGPDTVRSLVNQTGLLRDFTTWSVLLNNARSLFVSAMLSVLSLGTLAVLLLTAPAAIVMYLVFQIGKVGVNPLGFLAAGVLPHGILELPAAILATAQAMRMGDIILSPPEEGGGIMGIVRQLGYFIKLFLFVVLPLLLIASWIEVHITPVIFIRFLNSSF